MRLQRKQNLFAKVLAIENLSGGYTGRILLANS
jgi:hypothetical protein